LGESPSLKDCLQLPAGHFEFGFGGGKCGGGPLIQRRLGAHGFEFTAQRRKRSRAHHYAILFEGVRRALKLFGAAARQRLAH